jgi:plasmid maintenance system antidote protein VapI
MTTTHKFKDLTVKKGDRFRAMGATAEVVRASKSWADLKVWQPGTGASWNKRQPLPFPDDWTRIPPNLETHQFDPDWTIHPGVFWREVIEESGHSQAFVAREMGTSQKHLSQILSCHVTPGVEATVKFAQTMGVPVHTMWNLCCNYKLDVVLGKKDLTPDYL